MRESINKVFSASNTPGFGNIFIGDLESANNLSILQDNKIAAIVTVAKGYKLPHTNQQLPDYLYIPALDSVNFDLTIYFSQTSSFIQKCITYTNILVHCAAGISRSATIVIAFLMKYLDRDSAQVLKLVKKKRTVICPNPGFMLQLKFYESLLKAQRMNKMIRSRLSATEYSPKKIITLQNRTQNRLQVQPESIRLPSNESRTSRYSRKSSMRQEHNNSIIFPDRKFSLDKLKTRKNLKLSSNRKCFQKMVLHNQKTVGERLSRVLDINNI